MFRRETLALVILVAIPALGLAVNLIWPPENYAYLPEQGLLLLLALGALLTSRATATGAVFLYCSLALLPVGEMLGRWGGSSPLVFTPHLGIILVALTLRDERATICYGLVALVASGVFGFLMHDEGLAGALAFLSGGLSAAALWWIRDYSLESKLERAYSDLDDVQRGLKRITGELGNVPKKER